MSDPDTNAPEGNALPEALTADETFASFKTVEDLATSYKDIAAKAKTIGSIESIDEALRGDPNIKKYKDINELAKGHLETVKLVGRKGVILPNENASDEEKAKFYNAIGRPEKPEAYKLSPVEGLHESIKVSPEAQKAFAEAAHKVGLTQSQADGLNKWFLGNINNSILQEAQASEKALTEAATKLKAEWGGNFDANLNMAKRLVEKFGGAEGVSAFGELGNNPAVLRVLARIGSKMSEDAISRDGFSDLSVSTHEAQAKIKLINDKISKMSGNESDYAETIKERQKLYEIAYPEGA